MPRRMGRLLFIPSEVLLNWDFARNNDFTLEVRYVLFVVSIGNPGHIDHPCPVLSEQSDLNQIDKSLFSDIETLILASLSSPPWRIGSGIGCSEISGMGGQFLPERGAQLLRVFQ